ncbi:hypothetical protein, partial [Saccharopolyspora cebuensis]|uniref:hypothetical protein n=1 Tax=Saccharopolyspora cebuensis TaxID=418759 RepID=UPI0031E73983
MSEMTTVAVPTDWAAVYIEPGTAYYDEPSQIMPAGWHVNSASFSPEGEYVHEVLVGTVVDEAGEDISERVAHRIAEALNE